MKTSSVNTVIVRREIAIVIITAAWRMVEGQGDGHHE